jgi:hypothetical protein
LPGLAYAALPHVFLFLVAFHLETFVRTIVIVEE